MNMVYASIYLGLLTELTNIVFGVEILHTFLA